ncbi:MAG TPA: hypothetical protein VFG30_31900 [Polyangiales bacterium]|nr:hypothetical protein [Polyangiales bacterium]
MVGVGMVGAAAPAIAVGIIGVVGAPAPAAGGGIAGIPAPPPPPAIGAIVPLLPAWDGAGAVGGEVRLGLPAADVAIGGSELLPEAPAATGGGVAGHGGAVHAVAAGAVAPDSEHAVIAMPASTQLIV